MIYIIIAIGFIAILYYYFFIHRKKVLLKKMTSGIDMVKVGIYGRLSQRFKDKYGKEKAGWLAAAVTNELFSEPPSNPTAETFLESNKNIVEQELSNLQNDDVIRNITTQAIRVKTTVSYAKGAQTQKLLLDPIEKLKKFGILIPGGDAPSPETFLPMAHEFYESTKKKNNVARNST